MKIFGLEITKAEKKQKLEVKNWDIQQTNHLAKLSGFDVNIWKSSNYYTQRAYVNNMYVYSIVNYIITSASTVKFKLYKTLSDDRQKEIYSHEILTLLNNPNPFQSRSIFLENYLGYKILNGISYINFIKTDTSLLEMYVLPPKFVRAYSGSDYLSVDKYVFNNNITIPSENILVNKYFNPAIGNVNEQLEGLSPLSSALLNVQTSDEAFTSLLKQYQNLGMAGIISNQDETELTPEQISYIQDKYNLDYAGARNSGKVIVTNQKLNFVRTGLSAVDLSTIEFLKLSFQDLCSVFKFPSILLAQDNSSYNNYATAKKALWQDCLLPEINSFLDSFNHYLQSFYPGYLIAIDYNSIDAIKEDRKILSEYLEKCWFLNMNEKRLEFGYDEIVDELGSYYFIPKNLQGVKSIEDLIQLNNSNNQQQSA